MDIQEIPGYIQERVITIMKNYIGKITKIVTVEISQKKYNEVIYNIFRNTNLHMLCNIPRFEEYESIIQIKNLHKQSTLHQTSLSTR